MLTTVTPPIIAYRGNLPRPVRLTGDCRYAQKYLHKNLCILIFAS